MCALVQIMNITESFCLHGLKQFWYVRHRPSESSVCTAREDFVQHLQSLMRSLADHAPAAADATGDFLAAQFVARRLPPRPTVVPSPPSHRKLALRWVDPTAVRVVVESRPGQEAEIQIYHTVENVASSHMHPDLETWKCLEVLGSASGWSLF